MTEQLWRRRHAGDIHAYAAEKFTGVFQVDVCRGDEPTVWAPGHQPTLEAATRQADQLVQTTYHHICDHSCSSWEQVYPGSSVRLDRS